MERAVHLVTRLNVGGIARYLDAARDAVDILVRGVVEPGEKEAPWAGAQVRLAPLRRPLHLQHDARALSMLLHTLRKLRPSILHTHASKAGALGRIAARRLGIPCVHTFHGHVLEGYFPRPVSWLLAKTERALSRMATITATGPETARLLERRLRVPVEVVAPGVQMSAPSGNGRAKWRTSLGNPERIALAVARPAGVKDLDRFVRAAREAGYLPVAAGPDRLPGAVALGYVETMQDLYAACDVVVSASRAEGTPYALLEAAWCGRPAVATPVGDVAWLVGDGGLVTDDLKEGLVRLRDKKLRDRLGRAAAASVRLYGGGSSGPIMG